MDFKLLLFSIIIGILIFTLFYTIFLFYTVQKNKKENGYQSNKLHKYQFSVYFFLTKVPIIKNKLKNLKNRIYVKYNYDEYTLRIKTLSVFLISILSSLCIFIILILLYGKDLYMILVSIIMSIYLENLIEDLLVGSGTKLLKELVDYLNDIKHNFHMHGMVLESISAANDQASYLSSLHGKKLFDMLKSHDIIISEDYYENCPNRFLKTLFGLSYMTKEFGDKKVGGVSLYVRNLNYLIDEINLEVLKRDRLQYWLKSLTVISLIPIFFPSILGNWILKSFPETELFYNTSLNVYSKFLLILISFICYIFLKQMQNNDKNEYNQHTLINDFYEKLLNFKFIKGFINKIKPKHGSKRYRNLVTLIQDSGQNIKIEWLYIKQINFSILTFCLFIMLFLTAHNIDKINIIHKNPFGINNNYVTSVEQTLMKYYYEEDTAKVEKDKKEQYIKIQEQILSNTEKGKRLTESYIKDQLPDNLKDEEKQILIKIIMDKDKALQVKTSLSIVDILISLVAMITAFYIPTLILYFNKNVRKVDMEDEVFQFHTVILMYMHSDQASVKLILEWCRRFANIFYNPINKCINNLNSGPEKALLEMKQEVKYKPFQRIIDNLIISENISIEQSFDSLEIERSFYKDTRKEMNERSIANKVSMGKFIGFIPIYTLTALFFLLPLFYTSWVSFDNLINVLTQK